MQSEPPSPAGAQKAKHALDRVLAALGLVVLSPLFAGIGVWVAAEAGRPVVISQLRAGRGGVPFRMLKFRTMVPDAIEVGRRARAQRGSLRRRPGGPAHHARAAASCAGRPRRAPAARERPPRRDERRRPAARPRRAGRELHAEGSTPAPRRAARDHRLVADPRPRRDPLAGALRARRLVHRALVALARPEDRRAHVRPALPLRARSPSRTR